MPAAGAARSNSRRRSAFTSSGAAPSIKAFSWPSAFVWSPGRASTSVRASACTVCVRVVARATTSACTWRGVRVLATSPLRAARALVRAGGWAAGFATVLPVRPAAFLAARWEALLNADAAVSLVMGRVCCALKIR